MAKRISIINFKGGVGKTTLAFHLGTGLAWLHDARVLLVDMDHQSSLSVLCLRSGGWESAVEQSLTVGEIFRPFVDESDDLPSGEIIINSPMQSRDADYDWMHIVPSTLELDDIEIQLTSTHRGGDPLRSEWNKRTLICRWIEETGIDDKYDYIIFDCPPATKIVSQNAVAASQGYIIPVVPESMMERGTNHLRNMMSSGIDARLKAFASFGERRTMHVPDSELIGLAVTRIQTARGGYTNEHSQHLRSLRRRWGNALIDPYIVQGIGVAESLASGLPVYNLWKTQNVGGRGIHEQYQELVGNIKQRIDAL